MYRLRLGKLLLRALSHNSFVIDKVDALVLDGRVEPALDLGHFFQQLGDIGREQAVLGLCPRVET